MSLTAYSRLPVMMIATIIFRPLIIIALLVISIIFILQNQQPVLSLVIFGTQTIQLSLAIWVMVFTGAGVFTSLLLLLLYQSFGKTITSGSKVSIPPPAPDSPPQTQPSVREVFRQKQEEPLSDSRRFSERVSSPIDAQNPAQDWNREQVPDWDIETPPSQPTVIQKEDKEVERSFKEQQSGESWQPQSSNFEVQQQPLSASRQGTVYSYSYKEAKPPESRPAGQVYDADYRVINPPQQTDEDNEEEDWV